MLDQKRAIQLYLENRDKFPGMPQSEAIGLIRRSGGLPTAGAPAVPATALTPVAAPAPAAPAAAPAAPAEAPAAEGAPAPVMNQYESALAAFEKQYPNTPVPAPAKGAPTDYKALAERAATEARRAQLKADVETARTAKIDPKMQGIIDERLERYGEDIINADKDRKQALWMSIAQAGMKMAQSQSPYFMQALASGMEAGVEGYSDAKAKAAEKKARLQEAKEELSLKAIELQAQAVRDAIASRNASVQSAAATQALETGALKGLVAGEVAPFEVEAARLAPKLTQANIANVYSTISERAAAGNRAERALRASERGGAGGTGGLKLSQLNPVVNGAISENDRLREQLNDPLSSAQMTPAQKNGIRARIQANDQLIAYGRSLQRSKIGMGSGFRLID